MIRICAALFAAILVPAQSIAGAAAAKELKPKFGDVGGITYSDVSGNRESCLAALQRKIYLCRQNINFQSNTENRKYPGCLPIFRQQAEVCVEYFTLAKSRCHGSGRVDIRDFTGFRCTVTATVVEEGDEPERGAEAGPDIAPMDRRMAARTRVDLRAGPGADHRAVGSLAAGQEVQATGRAGDWLRIATPGGGTAFVHGQFMVAAAGREPTRQGTGSAARLSPKCAGRQRADCWLELANRPGCYKHNLTYFPRAKLNWSGACAGGVAVGNGTVSWKRGKDSLTETGGTMIRGKRHGKWVEQGIISGSPYYCVIRHYDHGSILSSKRLSGKRC